MRIISTYLVREHPHQKGSALVSVTAREWLNVVQKNKNLPEAAQRYFIREDILEDDVLDRMYIEVDLEQYVSWNKEKCRVYRQRRAQFGIQTLSLDAELDSAEASSLHEIIAGNCCVEDTIISALVLDAIRNDMIRWKPWAGAMFDIYLAGAQHHGFAYFVSVHKVSRSTFYNYRQEFEKKLKNYFETWNF